MKRSVLISLFISFIALSILPSCSEEEEESLYMTGYVTYSFPAYALVGATIETYSTGISYPKGVSYFWYSSTFQTDTIWSQKAVLTLPDSIGTFSISAGAKYDGYYNSVTTSQVITLDPVINSGSLKGLKVGEGTFVDPRDNNSYYYVTVGSLQWFSQNLRYAGTSDAPVGAPYANAEAVAPLFGNLYTWYDATGGVSGSGLGTGPQGACPEGWSVPTREDWEDLGKAINGGTTVSYDDNWNGLAGYLAVDATLNDERMWPYCPDFIKTNDYGWNAIPCGNSLNGYSHYKYVLQYGMWWSSTEANLSQGNYRYIFYNQEYVAQHNISKTDFGASVRCVRLKP